MLAEFGREDRLQRFQDLLRGIPIVNDALGLRIPVPSGTNWDSARLVDDAYAAPDQFYGQLLGAVFDHPCAPDAWDQLLPRVDEILPGRDWVDAAHARAAAMLECSDGELLELASTTFSIEPMDLPARIADQRLVFGKINHGFWEYLALAACERAGREYVRPLPSFPNYERSRFSEVAASALTAVHRRNLDRGLPHGTISRGDFGFGLSFGDGNCPALEELKLPLIPFVKGGIIGCVSCFSAIGASERWRVSDGSVPKSLFWDRKLDDVCARIAESSDAMVFIVPPHLASLGLHFWSGPVFPLVIPRGTADDLWPATLPTLVGALDRLSRNHTHLTVLAQAGGLAALLGIVLHLVRDRPEARRYRYIDMGQVLDVAARGCPDAGPWIKRRDVQESLSALTPSRLYLRS